MDITCICIIHLYTCTCTCTVHYTCTMYIMYIYICTCTHIHTYFSNHSRIYMYMYLFFGTGLSVNSRSFQIKFSMNFQLGTEYVSHNHPISFRAIYSQAVHTKVVWQQCSGLCCYNVLKKSGKDKNGSYAIYTLLTRILSEITYTTAQNYLLYGITVCTSAGAYMYMQACTCTVMTVYISLSRYG